LKEVYEMREAAKNQFRGTRRDDEKGERGPDQERMRAEKLTGP